MSAADEAAAAPGEAPYPVSHRAQAVLSNEEKVSQVCAMLELDEGTAMDLLEAHNWQIERAMELHFHRMANPTPTKAERPEPEQPLLTPELEPEPEPEAARPSPQPSPAKSEAANTSAVVATTPERDAPDEVTEPWPLSNFVVGGPIIVLSPKLKWREGTVVEIEPSGVIYDAEGVAVGTAPCIKVNYVGFNTAFDEWFDLSKDSARIRPAATRAAAKLRVGLGELSPNQRMQEHKKAEICLPWLNTSPAKPIAALK